MIYTEQVINYYRQANLDPLFSERDSDNYYTFEYGQESLGLHIIFQIRVVSGFVQCCRYKVFGCAYTIALCVWFEQRIVGKLLSELSLIELSSVIDFFSLPQTKYKCAVGIIDINQKILRLHA